MNRALAISATGMAAQQANLDLVADNLANADVPGFKAATATFASLGSSLGAVLTGSHPLFSQGKLMKTGGPFDVAIQGRGFFVVERDGACAYTRAGSFERAPDGRLRNAEGWRLSGVRIPREAIGVSVEPDGSVLVRTARGTQTAGRIVPAAFDADEELRPIGSALFAATAASGKARALRAGGAHGPTLVFGALEKSNVSVIESMMAILSAQRAYEANAKGVQAADEMLRIANNLARG